MCALRDSAPEFDKHKVTVYGVSLDDVKAQARFKQDHKLGFHLLSDPDGSVAKKFGVLMDGRPYARRVTFILDDKGVVRHITPKVNIAEHGSQVLEMIARLRG